jgi:peptidyl-prolyl cis-trans isomerase C
MQPGCIHPEPVLTQYGVHVVRLDRKAAATVLPFERVKHRIAAYLEDRVQRRAMAQYVSVLAGQAEIAGCDIAGAATALVQ